MKYAREQKHQFDYSQLKARTAELRKTDRMVAKAANMTASTYSLKTNGKGDFSQEQICSICIFLQIAFCDIPRYFFAEKV